MILYDILLIVVVLVGALLLYILAGIARKYVSSKWRAFYCLPAVLGMIFLGVEGFEISLFGAYLGAILLMTGFIKDDVKVRRIACVGAFVLTLITIPVCMFNKGYRSVDYVQDFKDGVDMMKEHYILTEHKGVDFDALYEKYLPMFEEANKNHDPVANYIAWCCFCAETNDGHNYFMAKDQDDMEEAYRRACGNDYGLSLMKLADGSIVAVNVEDNEFFKAAGIQNGTVITSWDGRDILEVARESLIFKMTTYADKDNEDFEVAIYAAGVGGDSVKITYLDTAGVEKELELSKMGDYYDRVEETREILLQGVATGHMMWEEVSEEAVALRIKMMQYDSEASKTENYSAMQQQIREKAAEYQAAGKTHLILDLRSNGGGSGQMVKAIASLFALPGEYYYCSDGLWDDKAEGYVKDADGNYVPGKEHYFQGENVWNGPITLLVNQNSASASDHLTMVMQGMENVTVMGFTEPNGSGQGLNGIHLESGDLSFSSALMMHKNGEIYIDSGMDRESGNQIDVVIPFDAEAVRVLFDEDEDYVLQKCLEYYQK
ncbi:MAG: peptidase S41 [Lachnospiraceae bacterium]|nr:peptidase S41 [Lachnospiraceae bacterium]